MLVLSGVYNGVIGRGVRIVSCVITWHTTIRKQILEILEKKEKEMTMQLRKIFLILFCCSLTPRFYSYMREPSELNSPIFFCLFASTLFA